MPPRDGRRPLRHVNQHADRRLKFNAKGKMQTLSHGQHTPSRGTQSGHAAWTPIHAGVAVVSLCILHFAFAFRQQAPRPVPPRVIWSSPSRAVRASRVLLAGRGVACVHRRSSALGAVVFFP
jgi:hypothetical protein